MSILIRLNQFGAFGVFRSDGTSVPLGAKHQALLALLSTSASGIRTRAFLEHTLWSLAQPEQAKASLRTALSTLKRHLGPEAAQAISANRERVTLDLQRVQFIQPEAHAEFMEGFELPHETRFESWLAQMRADFDAKYSGQPEASKGSPGRVLYDDLLPPIAVLPFVQHAPGEDTSPLGSLLSEELSRCLARSQAFTVTSYLASRQFDPTRVRSAEVSSVAGVNYLVSGVVHVRGQKMVLDVELHEAVREKVIWSRSFEGPLADLMTGQSEALRDVTRQIGQTLIGDAVRLVSFKPLSSLEGHTLLMAAISLMQEMNPASFEKSREILNVLLTREPQHPLPLTWMGFWHVMRVQKGYSSDRQLDTHLASQLATSALEADPAFSLAHTLKGAISSHLLFHFDLAQSEYDLALKDNPNEALAVLLKGATHAYQNRPEEAVKLTDAARRLSPLGPQRYYFDAESALANLTAGDYGRAIELADRSLQSNASYPGSLSTKAIALHMSGRRQEAKDVVQSLLDAIPTFSLAKYRQEHAVALGQVGERWTDALRQAGVPD
ncbi:transcriptional regulator [Phycobacter azelaicus]|uniref:transcriptional regulator n=1 Tax=Phycobacter azelaicus TaxID=2668075 RepID=UPI00186621BA|nr:transcriptional regulator [Phycobacter azelaicus]MBE1297691.1 transcriptional regulator [Paracoccaceae bacterium]